MAFIAGLKIFTTKLRRDPNQRLERLIRLAEEYPQSMLAQFSAAWEAWHHGDDALALHFAEHAEVLAPQSFLTLLVLTATLIETGDEDRAYFYAKRLLHVPRYDQTAWRVLRVLTAPARFAPKVRKKMDNKFSTTTSVSDAWVVWAQEFIVEYESRK